MFSVAAAATRLSNNATATVLGWGVTSNGGNLSQPLEVPSSLPNHPQRCVYQVSDVGSRVCLLLMTESLHIDGTQLELELNQMQRWSFPIIDLYFTLSDRAHTDLLSPIGVAGSQGARHLTGQLQDCLRANRRLHTSHHRPRHAVPWLETGRQGRLPRRFRYCSLSCCSNGKQRLGEQLKSSLRIICTLISCW